MGGAEAFRRDLPASTQLMLAACGIASAAIGYWALRRYLFLLQNAEFLAAQAVCEQCKVYARWDITTEDRGSATMEVCCRRCGHRWKIAL